MRVWVTPKYNSQELDKETGYYFYNARHYDPEISRFVTPDSVIDGETSTQGWNRYAYCHNNPIKYVDPTGHEIDTTMEDQGQAVYNELSGANDFVGPPAPDTTGVSEKLQDAGGAGGIGSIESKSARR